MGEKVYEIAPGLVWVSRVAGYAFLAAAMATAVFGVANSDEVPAWLMAMCVVGFGGFAYAGLVWVRPPQFYTLELSQDGIRQPRADRYVPWSSVARLRERSRFQRIDVECLNGAPGVSIEYQMKEFPEIMDRVLANVRCLDSVSTREFMARKSRAGSAVLGLTVSMLMGLGLWMALLEGQWEGWVLLIIFPVALLCDRFTEIHGVTVSHDRLILARGVRKREIPFESLRSVELGLRPVGQGHILLDVIAESRTGERIRLRPHGADAFQLHAAVARALAGA